MQNIYKVVGLFLSIAVLATIAACGAQPTPETITVVETVEVEKEVIKEVEVEKEVIKEVEVEKEVVKTVRPIIYNSYNSDPEPRRVDEMMVEMFNEQNPDMPLDHSVVQHEDFQASHPGLSRGRPGPRCDDLVCRQPRPLLH
jgi:hypothetical protein